MSGAAHAGGEGGCAYGEHLANETAQSPVLAAVDEAEAERLAKLKGIEKKEVLPIVHN